MGFTTSNKMNTFYVYTCLLLHPTSALTGSHSLSLLLTYIKGETAFPVFSAIFMLDDIIVGYYNSETKIYVSRGNTTNEDNVVDQSHLSTISDYVRVHFMRRSSHLRPVNNTETHVIYQIVSMCEVSTHKPGRMITKSAFRGSTVDELQFLDGKFTYQGSLNYTMLEMKPYLELAMWRLETLYYPACVETLKSYLKKRGTQVNRKVKPRVRLIQKASDSGWLVVSCLATGFYPRHINLTLLRDGQPVSDHEVTGGDLLPNVDGTYQMRKSLEIRAEERQKHKYTCSATHLSIDNKLIVTLEFEPGEPYKPVIFSVLIILVLVLMFGIGLFIYRCRKKRPVTSLSCDYSAASTSQETMKPAS